MNNKEIIIPLKHLAPGVRLLIGDPKLAREVFPIMVEYNLKTSRSYRSLLHGGSLLNLYLLQQYLAEKNFSGGVILGGLLLYGGKVHIKTAETVQNYHLRIIDLMKKHGILDTKFEGNYPPELMRPTDLSRTHPVFFVDFKGNVHFLKESRAEYARFKFQKTSVGKAGFHPWMYRAYLRPPEAPEKARDFVSAKFRQWRRLIPRPAFAYANNRDKLSGFDRRQVGRKRK